MKSKLIAIVMLSLVSLLVSPLTTARAQGTAFTYQGQLNANGTPANGSYDLIFTLYPGSTAVNPLAGPVTNTAVAVTNGLFTTLVDFGPGVFVGGSNWLALAVSTNAANTFTTLSPLQPVTPTPYALMAASATTVSGPVIASQLSGSIPAAAISGTLAPAQLPASVVTNGASGAELTGVALLNGGNTFDGSQIITNGNVGIGTNNPGSTQLTVAGDGGGNTFTIQSIQTASGDLTKGAISGFSLVPGGNGVVGESDVVATNLTGPAGANIALDGLSSATNGTAVDGFATAFSGTTYGVVGQVNSPQGFAGYFIGNTYLSGNVGIGTTTPAAGLTVTKNVSGGVGPTVLLENNAGAGYDKARLEFNDVSLPRAALEWTIINNNGAATWNFLDTFTASSTQGANSLLFLSPHQGVGIGTTNPVSALQVNGTVTATAFSGNGGGLTNLNATNLTGTVPAAALASLPAAQLTGTVADTALSANVALLNRDAQSFTGGVNTFAGKVGIGTTTPTTALQVNGTATATAVSAGDLTLTGGAQIPGLLRSGSETGTAEAPNLPGLALALRPGPSRCTQIPKTLFILNVLLVMSSMNEPSRG